MNDIPIEEILIRAIQQLKTLKLEDEEGGRPNKRVFEPHILFASKDGNVVLAGYQLDGATRAGKPPVWHHIPISKITRASANKATFLIRGGFNPNDRTKYHTVIAAAGQPPSE
ncbi:MAG: hypothetical protein EXR67_07740 [Dehalococcoidia bacterium]|nr:hypothetical protein [Dehalococcoidia bacterium]